MVQGQPPLSHSGTVKIFFANKPEIAARKAGASAFTRGARWQKTCQPVLNTWPESGPVNPNVTRLNAKRLKLPVFFKMLLRLVAGPASSH